MNEKVRHLATPGRWASFLFWSWNLIFLTFMVLGFAPTILPELRAAIATKMIPPTFLLYAGLLTLIPAVAVLVGLLLRRRSPWQLLALGYGVEAPLMLLLALRFFIVRQATPVVTLLLVAAGLGILAFLGQLLDRRIDERSPALSVLRLLGLTLLLLTGLYASIWIAFYVVPLVAQAGTFLSEMVGGVVNSIRHLRWSEVVWRQVPFTVLGLILLVYSATLFVVMPLAAAIFYTGAWQRALRHTWRRSGRALALGVTVTTVSLFGFLFVLANRQPQQEAFSLLEHPPSSDAEAQALLEREDEIRAGLLNSYLAPMRYVSAMGEAQHISRLYEWGLGISAQEAQEVRELYEVVARPLLYEPVTPLSPAEAASGDRRLRREPLEAATLYQEFFDQPITEGEHDAVVEAVRSTWSADQAFRGWQAVDDREVLLTRQEVTVSEAGDWATVELYEVYQNQTAQRREVVYYFSLPESAVVTGLSLGNSADRESRFSFHVAPRGAAQATYRNEIRRNVDPALLEQIGPSQYRLRIFPVEPQRWEQSEDSRQVIKDGPPLHLWLTWQVLLADASWSMPRLADKVNVYWDESTVRLLNGAPMPVAQEEWLPAALPAATPGAPQTHQVDFPGGQSVRWQPLSRAEWPEPAAGGRFAVVLDRSRSMQSLVGEVQAALAALPATAEAVDVYLTASPYRGDPPRRIPLNELDLEEVVYYGGQNAAELLAQFAALQGDTNYDAIFVLSDGSGYETGEHDIEVPVPATPVWMIHLGGDFPMGYDDATLAAIQGSGGGAVGSMDEALARVAVAQRAAQGTVRLDLADGYLWETRLAPAATPAGDAGQAAPDPLTAFAARRLILAEMEQRRAQLDSPQALDELHALAREYGIVTPYSSMIVLVNRRQESLLRRLSEADGRFEREYEAVGETAELDPVMVAGVPEPEEWLLILIAAGLFVWYFVNGRRKPRFV